MRFARRSRCLSLYARFPPFAASSYDRSAVRVTTFASATNGYSHNIYTVWSPYISPSSCVSYLLQVRHLVSRSSYPLSYPLRLWCLHTNLPVLLASFFTNPYSLHLTSSSRPFSLLPFRWLLYAFAIRVFQRLYTLHEISYSEYILQRKETDEGKTLWCRLPLLRADRVVRAL